MFIHMIYDVHVVNVLIPLDIDIAVRGHTHTIHNLFLQLISKHVFPQLTSNSMAPCNILQHGDQIPPPWEKLEERSKWLL